MFDMAISSQQKLRETNEQKIARWRREEQLDRKRLIQRGVVTSEQLTELDKEFTPETVNLVLLGEVEKIKSFASLKSQVAYAACFY